VSEEAPEKPVDDLELVERVKRKDAGAAEQLVRRYQEKAYAIAYRTCSGDAEEAKDLTQEAFLRAFRGLDQFQGKSSFYTWLYRIVVNTCLDGLRRQHRRRDLTPSRRADFGEGGPDGVLEGRVDPAAEDSPAERLARKQFRARVQKALSGLSSNQRMVFELKVFDELSISEIAGLMQSAEGTIKSHLFRATRHIREALKDWAENQ
jgi:RNA polymerase sigma-70 factor, ECF subfamily